MINSLAIQDGLDPPTEGSAQCTSTGQYYTYNSGVILEALVDISIATNNNTYITLATSIADKAISYFSRYNYELGCSVTVEVDSISICDNNRQAFKGIFIRGLYALSQVSSGVEASKKLVYTNYILQNKKALVANAANGAGLYNTQWDHKASTSTVTVSAIFNDKENTNPNSQKPSTNTNEQFSKGMIGSVDKEQDEYSNVSGIGKYGRARLLAGKVCDISKATEFSVTSTCAAINLLTSAASIEMNN